MQDAVPGMPTNGALSESDLVALLRELGEHAEWEICPRAARRSAENALDGAPSSWSEPLEQAAAGVGLRVSWVLAPAAEVLPQARPNRPFVTRAHGAWIMVDGWRFGRAHLQRVPQLPVPIWTRLNDDTFEGTATSPQVWAIVEPALPAAALSSSKDSRLPPLQRLRALIAAERQDLWSIVLYGLGIGVLGLATPLVMQVLINWLAFGALLQPLVALAFGLLLCLALAAVLNALQRVAVEMVQRRIFIRIAADVTGRLSRLNVTTFDDRSGPKLVNRFFDALTVQKTVSSLMLDGLAAVLQALVSMVLLAAYHPTLFGFDVGLVLCFIGVMFFLGRNGNETAIKESKAKYKVAGWIEEVASHPVAFRLGGSERLAVERADQLLDAWHKYRKDHFRIFFRQLVASWVVQVLASAALLVLCGWLVLDGQLTLGQLVAAEFVVTSMLAGFTKLVGKLDSWYDLVAGVDKLGELVDLPNEPPVGVSRPVRGPAEVALEGLPVSGHTCDLELAAGDRVAICVTAGCNTTRLAEILIGVREAPQGTVLRDKMDIRSWHPDALHREDALVTPGNVLNASILDNVAMGRARTDAGRVWDALERVGLAAVVRKLPHTLDTVLGPTGTPLTPPQLVRLQVARAILGNPRFIVIDSLLDGLTRADREAMLDVLAPRRPSWTLIVLTRDPDVASLLPQTVDFTRGPAHA